MPASANSIEQVDNESGQNDRARASSARKHDSLALADDVYDSLRWLVASLPGFRKDRPITHHSTPKVLQY